VLIVGAFTGYVYAASSLLLSRTYAVTPPRISIPSDDASIARGRYLAETVALCSDCHGKDLGGRVLLENPAMGQLVAPNLTRGRGGLTAAYSDQDLVRAMLHGLRRDGRSVVLMPAGTYTESELAAIIAYVRSVPPIDREQPPGTLGPVTRALGLFGRFPIAPASTIDHDRVTFARAHDLTDPVRVGEHLVTTGGCRNCHGPELTGGGGPPPGGSNITPTGMKGWTEADFITAIRLKTLPGASPR
jgi:mono/diheme cytochrome c family protein